MANNVVAIMLDVSSSMRSNEVGTALGVKELIRILQLREDDAVFAYSTFEGNYYPRSDCHFVPVAEIPDIEYRAGGRGTYLSSCTISWIEDIKKYIEGLPLNERPEHVFAILQTDGESDVGYAPGYVKTCLASQSPQWHFIGIGDASLGQWVSAVGEERQRMIEEREKEMRSTLERLSIPPEWIVAYHNETTVDTFRRIATVILEETAVPGTHAGIREVV